MNHGIIKAVFNLGGGNFIKLICAIIYFKVLTTYIDPVAFGYLSQLITLISIFAMLSLGGANNAIVRQMSEKKLGSESWKAIYANAAGLLMCCSIIIFAIMVLFSFNLARAILFDENYWYLFCIYGIIQIIVGIGVLTNIIFNAALNTSASRTQTIFNAMMSIIFVTGSGYFYGKTGVLISILFMNVFSGVYGFIFLVKLKKNHIIQLFHYKLPNYKFIKLSYKYALITVLGAIIGPITQIGVRDFLSGYIGWDKIGFWFATVKISDAYIQFFSVIILGYVFPKLTSCKDLPAKVKEFKKIICMFLILLVSSSSILFFARHIIVGLFLGAEYVNVNSYIPLQLCGDFIKIVSALLLTFILSLNITRISMTVEIANGVLFCIFNYFLVGFLGWKTPLVSYVIVQLIILIFVALSLMRIIRHK